MPSQNSNLLRMIERHLLTAGLALVLVYSFARIHSVVM